MEDEVGKLPPTEGLFGSPPSSDEVEEQRLVQSLKSSLVGSAAAPIKIDRFVVLERLGKGGIGVVYAAYDPKLDRKVAIKLLRPGSREGSDGETARGRLLREAQAMAQLSHRNVLPVHDVGEHGEQVYLVLELVEGRDLGAWLGKGRYAWREVLRIFVEAGRGLSAAHSAGLIHRDFKPGNVMLGDDGRVQVMDFGLARPAGHISSSRMAASLNEPLPFETVDGVIVGTPAYMSPEQHRGEDLDARADQFSFCVSLYEALHGGRPFGGKTRGELLDAIEAGAPEPPRSSRVPAWLHKTVVRGLAAKPGDRWPDMASLLVALGRDPARRMRRGGLLATGVIAAVAIGYAASQARPENPCADVESKLEGVWDDARRQETTAAFGKSALPYASDSLARITNQLDRYAKTWTRSYRDACEATRIRGEVSDEVMHARLACLESRRRALSAVTDTVVTADDEVMEFAVEAVDRLPRLAECASPVPKTLEPAPPSDAVRAAVDEGRRTLARARALLSVGRYEQARAVANGVASGETAQRYAALFAEALLARGLAERQAGDYAAAERSLREAVLVGEEANHVRVAAQARVVLVSVVGTHLAQFHAGEAWARNAEATIRRLGGVPTLEIDLLNAEGWIDHRRGYPNLARDKFERALALSKEHLGEDHPTTTYTMGRLSSALHATEDIEASLKLSKQVLQQNTEAFGPDHPSTAMSHNNLGTILVRIHRYEEALGHHQSSLDIWTKALPEGHPHFSLAHANLGVVLSHLDRMDEAIAEYEHALRLDKARLGEHPSLTLTHLNLGMTQLQAGHPEAALKNLDAGLAMAKATLAADHPRILELHITRAETLLALDRAVDAQTDCDLAIAILERRPDLDPTDTLGTWDTIGRARLAVADEAGARQALARVESAERRIDPPEPGFRGQRAFLEARVAWELDHDAEAAKKALEEAQTAFRPLQGAWYRADLAEAEAYAAKLP